MPETTTILLPRFVILCSVLPSKTLPILYIHSENASGLPDHGKVMTMGRGRLYSSNPKPLPAEPVL